MIIRRLLPALAFAGTLAAQTLIQMSHPQFGMYTKNEGFAHETVNFDWGECLNKVMASVQAVRGRPVLQGFLAIEEHSRALRGFPAASEG